MRLGGPQSRSGRGSLEKNSQPLPGLEPTPLHNLNIFQEIHLIILTSIYDIYFHSYSKTDFGGMKIGIF
jgi:hypothetical protein